VGLKMATFVLKKAPSKPGLLAITGTVIFVNAPNACLWSAAKALRVVKDKTRAAMVFFIFFSLI
jgi:hypothetical protein